LTPSFLLPLRILLSCSLLPLSESSRFIVSLRWACSVDLQTAHSTDNDWSADATAGLWDLSTDLDFPPDEVEPWIQAVTGAELNLESHQLVNIEPERWRRIKAEYDRIAQAHAQVCKYRSANQWLLFHKQPQAVPQ
jgi:hypothetical protein